MQATYMGDCPKFNATIESPVEFELNGLAESDVAIPSTIRTDCPLCGASHVLERVEA